MARLLLITSFLILLSVSVGCTYWYQEGKSFDQCEQDLVKCYCDLKSYADMDSISTYEDEFMKDCMKQKGYELVGEDKLPPKVKRRDPEMNTFWLLAGTAGTIETPKCSLQTKYDR